MSVLQYFCSDYIQPSSGVHTSGTCKVPVYEHLKDLSMTKLSPVHVLTDDFSVFKTR